MEQLLRRILKDEADEYLIERLSLLLRHIRCYLSSSLSNKICRVFLHAIEQDLHQADRRNLKLCLPNLKYRLDPRCLLVLKRFWSDEALYYAGLFKPFWSFRDTLEQRHQLFQYLSDS